MTDYVKWQKGTYALTGPTVKSTAPRMGADKYNDRTFLLYPCKWSFEKLRKGGYSFDQTALDESKRLGSFYVKLENLKQNETTMPGLEWLKPWQNSGVRWLLERKRGLLLDKMRMGKTTTALTAARLTGGRTLVLTKKGLRQWWENEAKLRFSNWLVYTGLDSIPTPIPSAAVVVVHYHVLQKKAWADILKKIEWTTIIVDECHHIKGRGSQRFQALESLATKAENLYLLSGTPVDGKPQELWPYLYLIDSRLFNSYWRFARTFTHVTRTTWGMEESGTRNEEFLASLVSLYSIQRARKWDHGVDEHVIPVVMSPKQRQMYRQMRSLYRVNNDDGEILTSASNAPVRDVRLRQILAHPAMIDGAIKESPKIDAAVDLIEDLTGQGRRVIVFSSFIAPAEALAAHFSQALLVTGKQKLVLSDVTKRLEQAKVEGRPDIVICTYDYASEGVGFHAADACIFLDLPWSSIKLRQARERLSGPLQDRNVELFFLVCENTIDEKVAHLHIAKSEFNDKVLADVIIQEIKNET